MKALVRHMLGMAMLLALATASFAADRAIIILDASGSMWAQIDGKPKLEIARETLHSILPTLPPDMELGFMAYGHRQKGSCDDIELIVPPAAGTEAAIATAADNLKFLGKTPLTAAVKQAAEALKYTEDKATVILITDGLETCGGDPCALGKELEQSGVDFTADVVGFGLTEEEGRQVACLADNTGGKYFQAKDAAGLKDALEQTVAAPEPAPAPAPEPANPQFNFLPTVVLAEGGDPITDGNAWEIYKANADGTQGEHVDTNYGEYKGLLAAGDYLVVARLGEAHTEQKFTIEPGKVYQPVFILDAGRLIIHPRPSEGAEIDDGARLDFDYPGGHTTTYGDTKVVLPSGDEKVTATIGNGIATETYQLAAGQTLEKDIVVGVGHLVANAYYTQGGDKVDTGGLAFQVVKAKKKIDGTREDMGTTYGPDSKYDLPPGDYALIATMDQASVELPFTMKSGDSLNLDVNLNAGVLAVTAPGADKIEIMSARKDIQGNRKSFGYSYAEEHQGTLPPGDYAVVVTMPDNGGTKESAATVKAGERTEVTVP
jgi:Ca-activated chloride channel family protein